VPSTGPASRTSNTRRSRVNLVIRSVSIEVPLSPPSRNRNGPKSTGPGVAGRLPPAAVSTASVETPRARRNSSAAPPNTEGWAGQGLGACLAAGCARSNQRHTSASRCVTPSTSVRQGRRYDGSDGWIGPQHGATAGGAKLEHRATWSGTPTAA